MTLTMIINTNRIIAALIKDSVSRKIIYHADFEIIGINFGFKEIEKYKDYIMKKAKIENNEEYERLLEKICNRIIFIDDRLIDLNIEKGKEIMYAIDPADVPFIAAALATGADIWSDDPHFQKQNKIKIWKTEQLIKFLE